MVGSQMRRRGLRAGAALAALAAIGLGPGAAAQPAGVRNPEAFLSMSVRDGFTIASVGDVILSRPIAKLPESAALTAVLEGADVATANCECVIYDTRSNRLPVYTPSHLWPLVMHPSTAKDLKDLGFDIVSRANNQALGYGFEGLRETSRILDEADLPHAGTGETLTLARSANYVETPRGRVAMVSMTSTFDAWNAAADPTGEVPGHPGLSGLRLTPYNIVTPEEMRALRALQASRPPARAMGATAASMAVGPDELLLFGVRYKEGDPKRGLVQYRMNERDRQEILKAIRTGKANADFLVATIHAHEQVPDTPDFLVELAHAAIDNGADSFVGHGPHLLRGIEIYRGKPIFYSLGDFAFDITLATQPLASEIAKGRGLDLSARTAPEYTSMGWDAAAPELYESVIAVSRFDNDGVREIRLYPVEAGWERRPAQRGVPRLASPEKARKILADLQRMSQRFGTRIAVEKNVGVIRLPRTGS